MIAPWQMVSGGPSHFVGPFFSGANAYAGEIAGP